MSSPLQPVQDCDVAYVSTVTDNEKLFSRRDIAQARRARDLEERMGFTPVQKVRMMLNAGAVIECPVTSRDVTVAESIYGPSVPGLKGWTTRTRPNEGRKVEPGGDLQSKELHLHADIMYINEQPFLLGVFMPIDLTVVTSLNGTRSKSKLRSAVEKQLNKVEKSGFSVPVIHCDNEFKDRISSTKQKHSL